MPKVMFVLRSYRMKVVYCIKRNPAMSVEQFRDYWLDEHGALVKRVANVIQAQKYVQSHTIAPEINDFLRKSRGMGQPYDGITEMWWESREQFEASTRQPGAQQAIQELIEDEKNFIDFSNSSFFITEEYPIF